MSREERRQYQRTIGRTRPGAGQPARRGGPGAPPGPAPARRGVPSAPAAPPPGLGLRFWIRTLLVAGLVGLLFLSLSWPQGVPASLYWGAGAAAVSVVVAVAIRLVRRRQAAR